MPAFREFELQAIRLMAQGVLPEDSLQVLRQAESGVGYEYTGCGYFLTIAHSSLPEERRTLSEPAVVGNAGDIQAGFLVFLGNHALTLECHTWGAVEVPYNFRELDVAISTPPINFVDRGNAI